MPRIHVTPLAVPEDVIDVNGHVNNLAYLHWMLDAATRHSAERGWTVERYRALGAGWLVRSHFIEYRRQVFAGETLRLCTWVAGAKGLTSRRRYAFLREADGSAVVTAETEWAFVDFASGRPVRIPPEVRSAFPIVADDDAELIALGVGPHGKARDCL